MKRLAWVPSKMPTNMRERRRRNACPCRTGCQMFVRCHTPKRVQRPTFECIRNANVYSDEMAHRKNERNYYRKCYEWNNIEFRCYEIWFSENDARVTILNSLRGSHITSECQIFDRLLFRLNSLSRPRARAHAHTNKTKMNLRWCGIYVERIWWRLPSMIWIGYYVMCTHATRRT